jgi:hypothetical protein
MIDILAQLSETAAGGAIGGAIVSAVVLLAKLLPWYKADGLPERVARIEETVLRIETDIRRLPCGPDAYRCPRGKNGSA